MVQGSETSEKEVAEGHRQWTVLGHAEKIGRSKMFAGRDTGDRILSPEFDKKKKKNRQGSGNAGAKAGQKTSGKKRSPSTEAKSAFAREKRGIRGKKAKKETFVGAGRRTQ